MARPTAVWRAAPAPEIALADGVTDVDPRLARLLARRGLENADEVGRFLSPSLSDLHDPRRLAGLPEAVERLLAARELGERVSIVGDYDVDGVSATAMLLAVFRACGLEADSILPHRMAEGYGFQPVHVERAEANGSRLIVTADCGSRSIDAAKAALERDISVIVTDHHIPGPALDPRVIEINPHQEACDYPYRELSGAGLAFKLAIALAEAAGREVDPIALLRIACLGTIADLVPLTGENRTIAALGLEALDTTRSAGLKALIEVSRVRQSVTAGDVGFRLGPRLNAAGRMDNPEPALELLLERDPVRARDLAETLDRWNQERQRAELAVVEEARARFLDTGKALPRFLMAWSPDWHRGVLGIAAGRLAREFHRPAILLSLQGAGDDAIAVGSGRSVRGVHLHDFLSAFEDRFRRFGGHAQAIGISIEIDVLEEVDRAFQEAAEAWDPDVLVPSYEYEEHLEVEAVSLDLVDQLDRLEPFGMANRRPLFRLGPLSLAVPPRQFGKDHLGLRARDDSGVAVDLVAWRWADRTELFSEPFEVLGHLKVDSYLGRASVEIVDARPATAGLQDP
ncbi:MAG: single-stranded-DNA-specific exonuclease RecJ [bacterium]|nr:single-stranded-DNA-specific exonuclease RecJ [bacterium]